MYIYAVSWFTLLSNIHHTAPLCTSELHPYRQRLYIQARLYQLLLCGVFDGKFFARCWRREEFKQETFRRCWFCTLFWCISAFKGNSCFLCLLAQTNGDCLNVHAVQYILPFGSAVLTLPMYGHAISVQDIADVWTTAVVLESLSSKPTAMLFFCS